MKHFGKSTRTTFYMCSLAGLPGFYFLVRLHVPLTLHFPPFPTTPPTWVLVALYPSRHDRGHKGHAWLVAAKGHQVGTELRTLLLLPSKPGGIPLSLLLPVSHDFWEDVGQGELHNHPLLFRFNRVLKHCLSLLSCNSYIRQDHDQGQRHKLKGHQIHFILLQCNKEWEYFIKKWNIRTNANPGGRIGAEWKYGASIRGV